MSDLGGFFDVLMNNRSDLEELVAQLGGFDATLRFAGAAGPSLIRIASTFAQHQDPVAAAAQAQQVLAYTQRTMDRVKSFQAAHGLDADGIVGDLTWAKVEELIAARGAT